MHKILYVEDNKDTANAVKTILDSEGCNVELAFTGNDGLKKLKEKKFDLVLLDIMLPDINGIKVFEEAVKRNRNCRYAILSIITVSQSELKELMEKGMTGCIKKPFRKDDLIKSVKKLMK